MGRTRRVAIIQPSVPQYRVPFFARLIAAAHEEGIRIDVFAGETPMETRARGDSSDAAFIRPLGTRELAVRGKTLFYKSTAPIVRGDYDLIIVEHAVRNIETYELLIRLRKRRVAFWGHGRTYTKPVSAQQESLKYWLARQATWFFGYTARGVDAVVGQGFPRTRTTVLNNAIDTAALHTDLSMVSDSDVQEFSRKHDLCGRTALYIGGIDSYKRIPFLLESAAQAHELCSDFRLLVAGNGSDRPIVEEFAAGNSWARYLGVVHGREKALALRASQAVAIPGAIGLVALDSMVAGTPIVTTDLPFHGPEFDYLTDGVTSVVTADSIASYAAELVALLKDQPRQIQMGNSGQIQAASYTLEQMVSRFLAGLESALG